MNTNTNNGLTQDIILCSFTADDAGNADALRYLYGTHHLYCSALGWMNYVGTHWQEDTDGAKIKRQAVQALRTRRIAAVNESKEAVIKCTKGDAGRVSGCVGIFQTLVYEDVSKFDNDKDMLNCRNGVVDLRTGHITPHSIDQRFTYCVPVDYDASDATEWLSFLTSVVGGGQEVIDYLQMALGYSLTGHTTEEILFYLYGPTRAGKGTFSEAYMGLLPEPLSIGVDFNSFTTKRDGDTSSFDLAPLKASRMVFASESNKNQQLNPAKIKTLTGGDRIQCCFKFRDHFTYKPQFKVWMMSNHPVNGDVDDDALWARVRVIDFPHSFVGVEDKSKKQRMTAPDMQRAILHWTVQGAIKWYALGCKGLTTPTVIMDATQRVRDEQDYIKQWLEETELASIDGWVSNEDVATDYLVWCEDNNVQNPKAKNALSQSLKVHGFITGVQRKHGGRNIKGVVGFTENRLKKVTGNDGNDDFQKVATGKKFENFPEISVTCVTRYPTDENGESSALDADIKRDKATSYLNGVQKKAKRRNYE